MLLLDDEAAVCETIALAIGLCEGTIGDLYRASADLRDVGYDTAAVDSASVALQRYADHLPIIVSAETTVAPTQAGNYQSHRL